MNDFKSPLHIDEICTAIHRTLKKVTGVYYAKHRSWYEFVAHSDNYLDKTDYSKLEERCKETIPLIKDNKEGSTTAIRKLALECLPICTVHNSKDKYLHVSKFYELLSTGNEKSNCDKMPLQDLAIIYLSLANNDWTDPRVLHKELEEALEKAVKDIFPQRKECDTELEEICRKIALSYLPLCVAHDSQTQFPIAYKFFELLSAYGSIKSSGGRIALRRLAEIYLDLAQSNWVTSSVLTKSLEQLFSYDYERPFGSLLCCAMMSGWYDEVISIIIPRLNLFSKAKIGKYRFGQGNSSSKENLAFSDFRILEFVAKWFDEIAVNMLKGVLPRDPFNYYVFECAADQRRFFTTQVDNVKDKEGGNNESIGRRYAFLAALFYQLDYIVCPEKFSKKEAYHFFWRTANCYANAAHMKEAVFYAYHARKGYDSLYSKNISLPNSNLDFCGDIMNIYYLNERYDKLVETRKILMPNDNIEECDKSVKKDPQRPYLLDSVKRKIIVYTASKNRFTSDIKEYKQGLLKDSITKARIDNVIKNNWQQFHAVVDKVVKPNGGERTNKYEKLIIACFFARTVFFKDSYQYHFCTKEKEPSMKKTTIVKDIVQAAEKIDSCFKNVKEKNVWHFLKALVFLKYALLISVKFENGGLAEKNTTDKMEEGQKEDDQRTLLEEAWKSLLAIESGKSFLVRTHFAIKKLKPVQEKLDKNNDKDNKTMNEAVLKTLLFVFMTFRIQDILTVSIDDIRGSTPNDEKKLCAYMPMQSLFKWLEESTHKGCPLTMFNVNYFNDPREGRIINDYIFNKNGRDNSEKSVVSLPPKVFLKSFTLNYDNLPMWDRYADKGKGVSVYLDPSSFGRSAENLSTSDESEIIAARIDDSNSIFRVAYCAVGGDGLFSKVEGVTHIKENSAPDKRICEEVNELVKEMKKVKRDIDSKLESLANGCWNECKLAVNDVMEYYSERISYLFKDKAHEFEQELRVISYDYDLVKEFWAEPFPHMAVKWSNSVVFKEIMFGPRLTDAVIDSCTPYINHRIEYINRWATEKEVPKCKLTHSIIKAR